MESKNQEHWQKTKSLMIKVLVIWFVFSYLIHFFVMSLNQVSFLKFPLGFYMASQGSLIVFVLVIFWFANKQNQIDEEFDLNEDDD